MVLRIILGKIINIIFDRPFMGGDQRIPNDAALNSLFDEIRTFY